MPTAGGGSSGLPFGTPPPLTGGFGARGLTAGGAAADLGRPGSAASGGSPTPSFELMLNTAQLPRGTFPSYVDTLTQQLASGMTGTGATPGTLPGLGNLSTSTSGFDALAGTAAPPLRG